MMKKTVLTLIFICLALTGYAYFIEPGDLRLKRVTIKDKDFYSLFKERKIALLSDIHMGEKWNPVHDRAVELVKSIAPHMIVFTGDYVEWYADKKVYDNAVRFLSEFEALLGVYAVMGDADYSRSRNACILCHNERDYGINLSHKVTFLRNNILPIRVNGQEVRLAGLDKGGDGYRKVLRSIKGLSEPIMILSHQSEKFSSFNNKQSLLFLAGDSHGGQILMPSFFWKLVKRKDDPGHMYGFFHEGRKYLYVTSGIGTSAIFPFRLGVSPEVVIIDFEDEK